MSTSSNALRKHLRQSRYLVQQGLAFPRRVLQHLSQLVIDLETRGGRRIPLCRLDAGYLEFEKELGNLDGGKIPSDRPDPRLCGEVDIELFLECRQVVAC